MQWYGWKPYVPVALRRARALEKMQQLRKKGIRIQPVALEGRTIARTFWGKAWCDHLESFSDFNNRLPRGRTYVRNGSVCHLDIARGEVSALVSGSQLYKVQVTINTLPPQQWRDVKERCAGQIGSILELLQGRLSDNVMTVVTDRDHGLFPLPREIRLKCSCPDWAVMCKHVAAVLYGVGARLDKTPELLFRLRGVDHEELITAEVGVATATEKTKGVRRRIAEDAMSDVFGIEMMQTPPLERGSVRRRKKTMPASKGRSQVVGKPARKGNGKTGKAATPGEKTPRPPKVGAKGGAKSALNARPVTGRAVAALRAKLGLSQREFAMLLGVGVPTVGSWERKPQALNLQPRSLEVWNRVKRLTKRQAEKEIGYQ